MKCFRNLYDPQKKINNLCVKIIVVKSLGDRRKKKERSSVRKREKNWNTPNEL